MLPIQKLSLGGLIASIVDDEYIEGIRSDWEIVDWRLYCRRDVGGSDDE